jgi:hypothetical protein
MHRHPVKQPYLRRRAEGEADAIGTASPEMDEGSGSSPVQDRHAASGPQQALARFGAAMLLASNQSQNRVLRPPVVSGSPVRFRCDRVLRVPATRHQAIGNTTFSRAFC